jgi:heat shock protein HslJ
MSDVAAAPNPLQDRVFVATSITEDGVPRPIVTGTEVRLRFRPGRLGANAGCNAVQFAVRVDPHRLVTGQGISTLMACSDDRMAQEAWVTRFLDADPGWSLVEGTLVLSTENARVELSEDVSGPRPQ